MKQLNLGAGRDIREDAVNLDISKHHPGVDVVHDLNVIPYPFDDNTFDKVYALSVLEHLKPTLIESLNEIWRVLKPQGILSVKYPLVTSPTIFDDPTHVHFWSMAVLDYVDPSTRYGQDYGFYTPYKWTILEKKAHKDLSCHAVLRKQV